MYLYVFVPLYLQKVNASPPKSSTSKSTDIKLVMQRGEVVPPVLLASKIEQVQNVISLLQCPVYIAFVFMIF